MIFVIVFFIFSVNFTEKNKHLCEGLNTTVNLPTTATILSTVPYSGTQTTTINLEMSSTQKILSTVPYNDTQTTKIKLKINATHNCLSKDIQLNNCINNTNVTELDLFGNRSINEHWYNHNGTNPNSPKAEILKLLCIHLNISIIHCKCPDIELQHRNLSGFCANPSLGTCVIQPYMKGQIIFTVIASIVGIIGNSFVLIIRSSQSRTMSMHYKLILGLALADLVFSILQLTRNTPLLIYGCKWIYGHAMCKIIPSLLGISSSIDLGFIVIIAIERFVAIVYPLTSGISSKTFSVLISANVIISISSVIPMFLVFQIKDGQWRCEEDWSRYSNGSLIYSWILMVFFFIVPVTITAYLYYRSLNALKTTLFRREMLCIVDEKSRVKLVAENKRILCVLWSLLIAFVLLVSPNRIVWLAFEYMNPSSMSGDTFIVLKIFGTIPYSVHITVNPIIYSVVDKRFRMNAISFIKSGRRRLSTTSNTNSVMSNSVTTTNVLMGTSQL